MLIAGQIHRIRRFRGRMFHRWEQLYRMVTWKVGHAIFSLDKVMEARALLIPWPEGRTKP